MVKFRPIVAIAVIASAFFAHGANVDSVSTQMGTLVVDGSTYTATSLEYKASPSNSSAPYRTEAGWYAGIKLTWASGKQGASSTKAKVDDAYGLNTVDEYTVYNWGDKTPSGCGMNNTFSGSIKKMSTTEWCIYVTPDVMKTCAQQEKDYEVTLTIGGNTYKIIVPRTVTLVDDNGVQLYPITEQIDISGEELMFSPASSFFYDATEKRVSPTLSVNGLTATFDVAEGSVTNATAIGTYSVTVNGTGDFKGTTSGTWEIKNTEGAPTSVAASAAGSMTNEGNDFTLSDSSKLEYDAENGVWYAGITITWPMDKNDSWSVSGGGYAHYVKMESAQVTVSDGSLSHDSKSNKFRQSLTSGEKGFTYLDTTTWKVPLTPSIITTALAEEKTELKYTMNAGAFVWGDDTEGDPDGVAFADYTITIPLDGNLKLYDAYDNQAYPALPYVAQIGGKKYLSLADALNASVSGQTVALIAQDDSDGEVAVPAGVTVALGAFGSANATYVLLIGSVLTSDAECVVSTTETGYGVEMSGEGPYTYEVVLQHVHNWQVVPNGSVLTATCVAEACPLDPTTYSMSLFTGVNFGATEDVDSKVYDGTSMLCKAVYGEGFTNVFPNVEAHISVTKGVETVDTITDAGEYTVTMTVTGLEDEQSYELTRIVTISKIDISSATLAFSPASVTYNGAEQTVTPSVTVGGVTATLTDGLEVAAGTCSATEIGTYSVTVSGTGNFMGTAASANWSIVNTTGEPVSVTESAAGSMTKSGNDFTLSDSSKLEYDAENGVWYAGITITWPMEKKKTLGIVSSVDYVTEDMVKVTKEYGEVNHVTEDYTYLVVNTITYVNTTTWKVGITPAIVETALDEGKTALEWTARAGAISSDTYEAGVEFRDYSITIPLEGITLYDENGKQVYPKTEGQTVIDEIKEEVETTNPDDKAKVEAKIDEVAEVAGEGKEQDVAKWVNNMVEKAGSPTTFFDALAESDYVKASFELGTETLITEESEVEVAEFVSMDDGFSFAVKVDDGDVEAARVRAASIIQSITSLGGDEKFKPLNADRIRFDGNKIIIDKDANVNSEFFKIVINKDGASAE